ncbi:MAG: hypothetical protein ABI461_03875 [Polyangiaceae bacterium]
MPIDAPRSKHRLTRIAVREAWRISALGLAAYAGVQLVAMIFTRNLIGANALQALVAEFSAGKLGVSWSDPEAPIPTMKAIAIRAGRGALVGAGLVLLAVAAVVIHGGSVSHGRFTIAGALLGLLSAGMIAMRDELLLRGVMLRAFRHLLPLPILFLVLGLIGGASRMGDPDATWIEITSSAALAIAFAAAWIHDRGGWLAWGAHTAWIWVGSTLARGLVFDTKAVGGGAIDTDVVAVGVLVVASLALARFSSKAAHPGSIAQPAAMKRISR